MPGTRALRAAATSTPAGLGDEADAGSAEGDVIEPADVDVPVEDEADSIAD